MPLLRIRRVAGEIGCDRFVGICLLCEVGVDGGQKGEAPELQLQAQGKTPFELCADTQHVRLLAKAMRTLTPRHRKFVELRFKREMSLSEIARETGTSLSTVKSTLYRSLRTLRMKTAFPEPRRA
jgi:RNA polymerase sigma factor (sigma-70 family)